MDEKVLLRQACAVDVTSMSDVYVRVAAILNRRATCRFLYVFCQVTRTHIRIRVPQKF